MILIINSDTVIFYRNPEKKAQENAGAGAAGSIKKPKDV